MSVPVDISSQITFKTARSGGKGGQNVNKVETMVEGLFDVNNSHTLTDEQKQTINTKLRNRIDSEGILHVRSQVHRSQLSNKLDVVQKMNTLIQAALRKEKKRIATKVLSPKWERTSVDCDWSLIVLERLEAPHN